MTDLVEHQTNIDRLASDLTALVELARSQMTERESRAPSLYQMKVRFVYDWEHPAFDASPVDFGYSLFHLAQDALEAGEDVMSYLCDKQSSSPGSLSINRPVAVSAIDIEGSEGGWPCATENPYVNGLIAVPESFRDEFRKRTTSVETVKFQCHSRASSVLSLSVQHTKFTEQGVAAAIQHVLRFNRTLPSTLFPAEANAICFANYPVE